jgi:hypothetical protein
MFKSILRWASGTRSDMLPMPKGRGFSAQHGSQRHRSLMGLPGP